MEEDKKKNTAVFKRECRSYLYYDNRIKMLNDRITLLDMNMQGVYSPVLDKIGQTPTRHEKDLELIIERKDNLLKVKNYYQEKMAWVKNTIDSIPSPAYRALVWATYVDREGLQKVADDFGVSRQHIYQVRRQFLDLILTDENMQVLEDIENRYQIKDDRIDKENDL